MNPYRPQADRLSHQLTQPPRLLSGAENAYGFGLSAALVVPMGSAGEAGW
jgi:hypothetical protein